MGKRRADAGSRRFFDEFPSVRISRFRATGVVDPEKNYALIPIGGKTKLFNTAHTHLKHGGGFSFFICPRCAKLTNTIYLVDDKPLCPRCCAAMGIAYRTSMGFGRSERRQARDKALDRLIAKVETTEPLRFKPAPANWGGRCRLVYRSRSLTWSMRRRLIELRLDQLASQQSGSLAKDGDTLRAYQPSQVAKQLIDTKPIWRARTSEALQQALDVAQDTILAALKSDDPQRRLNAAKLMLRTKQARERGS